MLYFNTFENVHLKCTPEHPPFQVSNSKYATGYRHDVASGTACC